MSLISRIHLKSLASGALSLVLSGSAAAQCAMCKATLAGDPEAVAASHRMNVAVLAMLVPAIVIFTGFFVLMYRHRDSFRGLPAGDAGLGRGDDDFHGGNLPAFRGSGGPEWS